MSKLVVLVFDEQCFQSLEAHISQKMHYYAQFEAANVDDLLRRWDIVKNRLAPKAGKILTIEMLQHLSDFIANWRTRCATRKEDSGDGGVRGEGSGPEPQDPSGSPRPNE